MDEAFGVFDDVSKYSFLDKKTVILFFNKYDLFLEKLPKVPVNKIFRDWPDGKDPTKEEDVLEFFDGKFNDILEKNKVNLSSPLFRHVTTALKTDMMNKIFLSISNDLVKQNLKAVGVL